MVFVLNSQQTCWVDGRYYFGCDCEVPAESSGCGEDLLGCPLVGLYWTFTGARVRVISRTRSRCERIVEISLKMDSMLLLVLFSVAKTFRAA